MLTIEDLKEAAHLQLVYGENPPGFITHDDNNLKGPRSLRGTAEIPIKTGSTPLTEKKIKISVSIEKDPETGEYRMIEK